MTHTSAAAPARTRPRASRGPHAKMPLNSSFSEKVQITYVTRLREAGMALEAIQAQAGHRSIESTRIYLHLANDWLAGEYRRAVEAIDAQAMQAP